MTNGDPAVGTPDTWATYVVRNGAGIVTDVHTPANVTAYTHTLASAGFTTSATAGLVNTFTMASSGGLRGRRHHRPTGDDLRTRCQGPEPLANEPDGPAFLPPAQRQLELPGHVASSENVTQCLIGNRTELSL